MSIIFYIGSISDRAYELRTLWIERGKIGRKNVVGIYKTENEAVSAINRFFQLGYKESEISVMAKGPKRFVRMESMTDVQVETPKAVARCAGAGAAIGGVLGGIGGLLLGLGALAIPCVGPFLAAGTIP
jgi:hypothetical protein